LEAIAYTSFFEAFVDAMKSLGKGEIRIDMDGRTLARELIPPHNCRESAYGGGDNMSRIWLGLPGNEQLLPAMGRKLSVEDFEITNENRTASGKLVRDVTAVKKDSRLTIICNK